MSKTINHPVIMIEDDYRALRPFAGGRRNDGGLSLSEELERAIIVRKNAFPKHAIRLYSQVTLLEKHTNKEISFMIVMPEDADMRQHKISALAPMAVAVLGFRKGEDISCLLPGGKRSFRIEEVINPTLAEGVTG